MTIKTNRSWAASGNLHCTNLQMTNRSVYSNLEIRVRKLPTSAEYSASRQKTGIVVMDGTGFTVIHTANKISVASEYDNPFSCLGKDPDPDLSSVCDFFRFIEKTWPQIDLTGILGTRSSK